MDRCIDFATGIVYLILALILLAASGWPVFSHEAPSGWHYDADCCSNQDCAPADAIEMLTLTAGERPVMVVTTKFGKRPVTPQTKIRESKDSQTHACIYMNALICLYVAPGN